jgi:hypothetical protein
MPAAGEPDHLAIITVWQWHLDLDSWIWAGKPPLPCVITNQVEMLHQIELRHRCGG